MLFSLRSPAATSRTASPRSPATTVNPATPTYDRPARGFSGGSGRGFGAGGGWDRDCRRASDLIKGRCSGTSAWWLAASVC